MNQFWSSCEVYQWQRGGYEVGPKQAIWKYEVLIYYELMTKYPKTMNAEMRSNEKEYLAEVMYHIIWLTLIILQSFELSRGHRLIFSDVESLYQCPFFLIFPIFRYCDNNVRLLTLTLIFDSCHRSLAAVTPVYHWRDLNNPMFL